jgi:FdhE protein
VSFYRRCRAELERYQAEQPGLTRFISLNQKILEIQESVRVVLEPTPAVSETGLVNLRAGKPALHNQKIEIPAAVLRKAAEALAAEFGNTSGEVFPVNRLLALPQLQGNDAGQLAEDVLTDRLDLAPVAEGTHFNVETMAYFLHSLLVPFFERYAEVYAPLVESKEISWPTGNCPVCGAPPRYGIYHGEKGFRKLYCGLCRAQWHYPRHKCPICETAGGGDSRNLKLGKDEAHMAEICDSCQMYLKATDERVLLRECLPAAEDVVTAAIDLAAAREGYSRPA